MNDVAFKVKRSGIVGRQLIQEDERGTTFVVENNSLPFKLARFYVIYDVTNSNIKRGGHAHKANDQALFVLKGSCDITLDDGEEQQVIKLTASDPGIRLGVCLWHTMGAFSSDCIMAVAASENYDYDDYITDYNEFLEYVSTV